jgi:hypothetical protein
LFLRYTLSLSSGSGSSGIRLFLSHTLGFRLCSSGGSGIRLFLSHTLGFRLCSSGGSGIRLFLSHTLGFSSGINDGHFSNSYFGNCRLDNRLL